MDGRGTMLKDTGTGVRDQRKGTIHLQKMIKMMMNISIKTMIHWIHLSIRTRISILRSLDLVLPRESSALKSFESILSSCSRCPRKSDNTAAPVLSVSAARDSVLVRESLVLETLPAIKSCLSKASSRFCCSCIAIRSRGSALAPPLVMEALRRSVRASSRDRSHSSYAAFLVAVRY